MAKTDMFASLTDAFGLREKLEILLKHWVKHNEEHAGEFQEWAEKAKSSGHIDAHDCILSTVESMRKAIELMRQKEIR
jgi:hypothetical protein